MTLKEYKDYFKTEFGWEDSISIGKIDNNQEKAICFYDSKFNIDYQAVIGGTTNKSTTIKPITILLRYTKNQDEAEKMARLIYKFFEERAFYIGNKRVFSKMIYENPNNLGTDDKNVYEYSIEINMFEEK